MRFYLEILSIIYWLLNCFVLTYSLGFLFCKNYDFLNQIIENSLYHVNDYNSFQL